MNKVFRSRHFSSLVNGGLLLLLIHLVGTLGYRYLGRPSAGWIDSFYMTFITVATIGYAEVYIVCGVGRVGGNVADELVKTRRPFVVVETDQAALDRWLERCPQTLYLHDDAADDDTLRRAGVLAAAGAFAVTGDDSHNLMISLSVKLLNPKARVVARLHDIRNADKARRAGADEIVSPDFTGGMRIASAMVRPHAVNFMDQMLRTDDGLRVEEVIVPDGVAARAVSQLIPKSRHYMLMATHQRGQWVFNPADDHIVQGGAALVLITSPEGREQVERLLKA